MDGKLIFDSIQCDKQQIHAKNIVFGHGTISGALFEKNSQNDILSKFNV